VKTGLSIVCLSRRHYFFRFVALGKRDAPALLFGLSLLCLSALLLLALLAAAAAVTAVAAAAVAAAAVAAAAVAAAAVAAAAVTGVGVRAAVLPRFVRTGLSELRLCALARLSPLAGRSALVAARFLEGL
jgi:hypothetical protein